MDVKFSPAYNLLSIGQITGEIKLYAYDESKMDNILTFNHHKESVRTIDYNPSGNILYAGSKDKSLSVISNGRVEGVLKEAHPEAISKVIHIENDHVVATGDDDGLIRIWDLRMAQAGDTKKACALELKEHEGTISDLSYVADKQMLLSTSNDGMLGVFDLRKADLYAMSDNF